MKFEPEKLKLTFEYIVENCGAGEMIRSSSYKGMSEAEMYEYARMSYRYGLILSIEDCSTLNDVGCFIGNPTITGHELYAQMCDQTKWDVVKKIIHAEGYMCLTKMIEAMVGKALQMIV